MSTIPFGFIKSTTEQQTLYVPVPSGAGFVDVSTAYSIGTINPELSATQFTNAADIFTFDFPTPVALTPGTKYAVELDASWTSNTSGKYITTHWNDNDFTTIPEHDAVYTDNNLFQSVDNGNTYTAYTPNFRMSYEISVDDGASGHEVLIDALPNIPVTKQGFGKINDPIRSIGFTFDMVGTGSTNIVNRIKIFLDRGTLFSNTVSLVIRTTTTA